SIAKFFLRSRQIEVQHEYSSSSCASADSSPGKDMNAAKRAFSDLFEAVDDLGPDGLSFTSVIRAAEPLTDRFRLIKEEVDKRQKNATEEPITKLPARPLILSRSQIMERVNAQKLAEAVEAATSTGATAAVGTPTAVEMAAKAAKIAQERAKASQQRQRQRQRQK
ncbi:hypothetical protein BGX27_002433, partial [Mortierella sp. AM989]